MTKQKYKRNHHISKSMLNYWRTRSKLRPNLGVWVYEIDKRKKSFANAEGPSAYTFAISNDVYVPTVEGERATGLERFFSDLEGALAGFASQVHEHQGSLAVDEQLDKSKILAALFALEYRSPDIIRQIQATFVSPDTVPPPVEMLSHQLALENVVNLVVENAASYALGSAYLFYSDKPNVLICDRPAFSDPTLAPTLAPKFFVLTSKVIVMLTKEKQGTEFAYVYQDLDEEDLDLLNRNVARQARLWIASTTEAQLDQYIQLFDSEEWKLYRYSTQVEKRAGTARGWKFKPDSQ